MTTFAVDFDWDGAGQVTLDTDGKLAFPRMPEDAGVYRFRLTGAGPTTVYIGESTSLRQRMNGYRNPGPTQQTNKRMNARFAAHLGAGGRIEVATASRVVITVGDTKIAERLSHTPQRRLVENLALIEADAEGVDHIENL